MGMKDGSGTVLEGYVMKGVIEITIPGVSGTGLKASRCRCVRMNGAFRYLYSEVAFYYAYAVLYTSAILSS